MPVNTKVHLLGLPQDNNSSFMKGSALAPPKILEALRSPSANLVTEAGLDLVENQLWIDAGNLRLDGLAGQEAFNAIRNGVGGLVDTGVPVLSLGGDHSVSYPAIAAHLDKYVGLNILHVDAHTDLYESFDNNRFSHASPFARLMETGRVNRLVQVGIRTATPHQREQAKRYNVEMHEMRDLSHLSDISFDGPVYLSFDLDVLDPAFAPGVSHFEPGGLSTRQALGLIQSFRGTLVGADVVELNPLRDPAGITAMVAAKICKELMGRILV